MGILFRSWFEGPTSAQRANAAEVDNLLAQINDYETRLANAEAAQKRFQEQLQQKFAQFQQSFEVTIAVVKKLDGIENDFNDVVHAVSKQRRLLYDAYINQKTVLADFQQLLQSSVSPETLEAGQAEDRTSRS